MKRIILAVILLTGILISNKSNAQIFIRGRVGLPIPRVYVRPVPPPVYGVAYNAPYYQAPVVVNESPVYYGNAYAGAYYYDHGHRFYRGRDWGYYHGCYYGRGRRW